MGDTPVDDSRVDMLEGGKMRNREKRLLIAILIGFVSGFLGCSIAQLICLIFGVGR